MTPPPEPSRLSGLRLRNDGLDTLEPGHPDLSPRVEGRRGHSLLRDLALLATGVVLGVGAMAVIGYRPEPHSSAALARSRELISLPAAPGRPEDNLVPVSPTAMTMMAPITAGLPPPTTTLVSAPADDGAAGATSGVVPAPATAAPSMATTAGTAVTTGTAAAPAGTPAAPSAPRAGFPRPLPLLLPVQGIGIGALSDTFAQARTSGRRHDALDIMAGEGTPVLAADDGVLTKLFTSKNGGLTLYQTAPGGQVVYYYAHLSAYAPNLAEGQALTRGQPIGFVGHTGDARAEAPHLHFAVYDLAPGAKWWQGQAENPLPLLRPEAATPATPVPQAPTASPAAGARTR